MESNFNATHPLVLRIPYFVPQETFFPNSLGNLTTYAITNPGIVAITTQTKNPG